MSHLFYMNIAEAADYLRVTRKTLYNWTYTERIPFRKHGGRVVFSKMDLDTWSNQQKVGPS